jgi:hypothetical protein
MSITAAFIVSCAILLAAGQPGIAMIFAFLFLLTAL